MKFDDSSGFEHVSFGLDDASAFDERRVSDDPLRVPPFAVFRVRSLRQNASQVFRRQDFLPVGMHEKLDVVAGSESLQVFRDSATGGR